MSHQKKQTHKVPETIEFISRLIEKKLLDFGIEAKGYYGSTWTSYN
jgi:hypothetical protein